MRQRRLQKSFAVIAAAGLLVAACGGDDDDDAGDDTEQPDDGDSGDSGDSGDDGDSGDSGDDGDSGDSGDDDGDGATSEDEVEAGDVAEGEVETEIVEVTQEAVYGGELIVGLEAEANGLRPWEDNCSTNCYAILNTIYDKLFETTKDGTVEGYLAKDITPNDDLTVWVMNLREGVSFSDGTPLTAQTIADMFPIQQAGAVSTGQVAAATLANVEATGDLEVTYTLSAPNVAFPSFLERTTLGHVFEPGAAAADPEGFNSNPIGTGPFTLDVRDIDNQTRVVRNPNYWRTDADGNQLPYLDAVSFRPIPEEQARLDSLISGTVNVMITSRQGTIRDARNALDESQVIEAQGNQSGGGYYNALVPPYDDVRVRRGLTHLNSQENVIEALGGTGISLPGTQQFSPDSPWYSEATAAAYPEFDPAKGTELLSEYINDPDRSDGRAVGDPIEVELSCPPDPTLTAAMQVIQAVWDGSGLVKVELTQFDQSTHISKAFASEHGAHCWRMGSDSDPALWVTATVGPPTEDIAVANGYDASRVASGNFPDWFDKDTYEASLAAAQVTDFETRYGLYEQVFTKMAEEAVFWYSGHTAFMTAHAENVYGLNGWTLPDGQLGVGILPDNNIRVTEAFIT